MRPCHFGAARSYLGVISMALEWPGVALASYRLSVRFALEAAKLSENN